MITHKYNTFNSIWPRTKENTWYGYKVTENFYEWWKSKKTAIKHIPNNKGEILRATYINGKMYINLHYLTLYGWR